MQNLLAFDKTFFFKRIPSLSIIIFTCITLTINGPIGFALSIPAIPIISLVFWSLHLGKLFNKFEIFILGIITDILIGTPIGSYALLYLLISILSNYAKYKILKINLFYYYLVSFLIILFADILSNLVLSVINQEFTSPRFILLGYLLTISCYPAFFIIFKWIIKISNLQKYYVEV